MSLLLYIIIFLSVLIVSNAMNKLFPSLPTPLVQILLGIGLRFLLPIGRFHLETEIFLALIIGPLLFREAEESDVTSILKHWKIVVYLIFPVIFLSTLSLGFLAHVLWAVLPLAACIAVGAALGPTDLVAFASLSERFTFPKRVENILKGEGLLNDASGLVAFQFALMAWMTGTFSIKQASFSLLISIIGGFIVGSFTAFLNRQLQKLLHTVRASDIAGELLLELSLPLLTFFLAEEIHVSGIIAVVVAGIFKASRFKRITLLEAQVNIVTDTIWQTVTFMLNGSVFVILGIELETIAEPILKNPVYDNFWLLLTILLLTIVLFAIRFVMISGFYFLRSLRLKKRMSNYWRDMALLTFSGVKGTVSIATILLIPTALEKKYPLLLFLVAGVTLLSFLTGLVVLPRLSENKEESSDYLMQIAILNDVVQELEKELKHTKVKAPLYAAIDNYHGRIEHLILEQEGKSVQKDLTDLQLLMLSIESDGLEQAYEERNISNRAYSIYQRYLWSMEQRINRNLASRLNYFLIVSFRIVRFLLHEVFTLGSTFRNWLNQDRINPSKTEKEEIAELYLANTEVIISSLENLKGVYNTALINFLQDSRIRETAIIESGAFIERVITRIKPNNIKEMLRGYYIWNGRLFLSMNTKSSSQRVMQNIFVKMLII